MAKLVAIIFGLAGGISVGMQSVVNSALGRVVGNIEGTFLSFLVGGVVAGALTLFFGQGNLGMALQVPPFWLSGGLFGVIIVFSIINSVQVLGAAGGLTLTIIGQLLTVLVIDHFGWFGAYQIPVDWVRLLGIILLIIGARLIIR